MYKYMYVHIYIDPGIEYIHMYTYLRVHTYVHIIYICINTCTIDRIFSGCGPTSFTITNINTS